MSSAKPVLVKEADCQIDDLNATPMTESESERSDQLTDNEEEMAVKKMLIRRHASPSITINRNGSRYIAPIDIVRSEAGRAEILRQRSQRDSGADKETHKDEAISKRETR